MSPRSRARTFWLAMICLHAGLFSAPGHAQERVYKCNNNVYTNNPQDPRLQGCKPMDNANVTVVQGTRPASIQPATGASGPKASTSTPSAAGSGSRVDAADQRARDSDARLILEGELKKAEARQSELLREYNNGEPEKQSSEVRNHQKYLDRVAELKAAIARNESDMAGIRREMGRLPAR